MSDARNEVSLTSRRTTEAVWRGVAAAATALTVVLLASVLVSVVGRGSRGLSMTTLTELPRPTGVAGGGVANAIWGTLLLMGLASAIALPVGLLAGIHLAENREGKLVRMARVSADALTAVPSVVLGIVVFSVVVVWAKSFSALAGASALAFTMIPSIARATEVAVRAVPEKLREAALALGATRHRVIARVVLPAASRGVATGALLAIGRASGEAAPLLFTAWESRFFCDDLREPTASLPVTIFTYTISPYDDRHAQAWAASLVLVALVLVFQVTARALAKKSRDAT
ncbi:MAG: phosphate ABC transporter permease PstA [Myxococcales bacterium]|nr:phosphate ABC transporter permease PstA [Myxococcales bacterium]MBL9112439.1 phosphate ABC transporter permease PstA [Myxococcales bacterium]